MSDFEFDVAFSFLGQDEHVAIQLNDLLKTRVTTFLYSDAERQKTLAGRDGEERFNHVFGTAARTVVVLSRAGWGAAGFTAVEATAIRNRAYSHGYEFTTFIPLDTPPTVPKWLPKTRLWAGLERWGLEHAATVIESRVSEAGGPPHQETAADLAAAIVRDREEAAKRKTLLGSPQGVEAARAAFNELTTALEVICANSSNLITSERVDPNFVMTSGNWRVVISLDIPYQNTLNEAFLDVAKQRIRLRPDQRLSTRHSHYKFALGPGFAPGWRSASRPSPPDPGSMLVFFNVGSDDDEPFITINEVAEAEVKTLLEYVRDEP